MYINFNGCSYDPKILFPTLLTSPEESKARLEKLRRKLSNQAGGSNPTEPTVPGVLVATLTRHICMASLRLVVYSAGFQECACVSSISHIRMNHEVQFVLLKAMASFALAIPVNLVTPSKILTPHRAR